jgi:queuine tRNA-ribosyltransferase
MPTRNGRNAMLFTTQGIINIDNKKWEFDHSVIDHELENNISSYYSKSYLRHLIKSKELLGLTIASVQNLAFYLWLVKEARKKIMDGSFYSWKKDILPVITRRL